MASYGLCYKPFADEEGLLNPSTDVILTVVKDRGIAGFFSKCYTTYDAGIWPNIQSVNGAHGWRILMAGPIHFTISTAYLVVLDTERKDAYYYNRIANGNIIRTHSPSPDMARALDAMQASISNLPSVRSVMDRVDSMLSGREGQVNAALSRQESKTVQMFSNLQIGGAVLIVVLAVTLTHLYSTKAAQEGALAQAISELKATNLKVKEVEAQATTATSAIMGMVTSLSGTVNDTVSSLTARVVGLGASIDASMANITAAFDYTRKVDDRQRTFELHATKRITRVDRRLATNEAGDEMRDNKLRDLTAEVDDMKRVVYGTNQRLIGPAPGGLALYERKLGWTDYIWSWVDYIWSWIMYFIWSVYYLAIFIFAARFGWAILRWLAWLACVLVCKCFEAKIRDRHRRAFPHRYSAGA